jgi:hypothetical protein
MPSWPKSGMTRRDIPIEELVATDAEMDHMVTELAGLATAGAEAAA